MQADGSIAAALDGYSVSLGQFSAAAIDRAGHLATGLPLTSFAGKSVLASQLRVLVQRLARHGLLEYRLFSPRDAQDLVVMRTQRRLDIRFVQFYMNRAACLWRGRIDVDANGTVAVPDGPGLGYEPDAEVMERYRVS